MDSRIVTNTKYGRLTLTAYVYAAGVDGEPVAFKVYDAEGRKIGTVSLQDGSPFHELRSTWRPYAADGWAGPHCNTPANAARQLAEQIALGAVAAQEG